MRMTQSNAIALHSLLMMVLAGGPTPVGIPRAS